MVTSVATVAQNGSPLPVDASLLETLLFRAGWFVLGFSIVLFLGWFVLAPAVNRLVGARNNNNPTLQEAIVRYVRVLVLVVAVVVGLGSAGFNRLLGNSALVVAAATLALGVAGQTVIGSLVSGLALVTDPEFNVGNYIRWSDGEGEVQSITLRVTRVRTRDGAQVTIPNTTLTDDAIVRPFASRRGRVVERVAISYDDDTGTATDVLEETAAGIEDVVADPPPEAVVDKLGGDAVILRTEFWVRDPRENELDARATFADRTKTALAAAGVTVSPTTERLLDGRIEVDRVA